LVRTIFEQPDADAVRTQHHHAVDGLAAKFLAATEDSVREVTK
jgi:hypothetical protein